MHLPLHWFLLRPQPFEVYSDRANSDLLQSCYRCYSLATSGACGADVNSENQSYYQSRINHKDAFHRIIGFHFFPAPFIMDSKSKREERDWMIQLIFTSYLSFAVNILESIGQEILQLEPESEIGE